MEIIQALNLPKAQLKLERKKGDLFVWCIIRRKSLLLTPEEWVRQHLIHFLIQQIGVPLERIASEYAIQVNGLTRRCDVVVVDKSGRPKMIVECKATSVPVTEKVLFQIAQYNRQLQVDYLMLSNGIQHFVSKIDHETGNLIPVEQMNATFFD